jgi:chaperone modulatory protein CbpM
MTKYSLIEAISYGGTSESMVLQFIEEKWVTPFDPKNKIFDDEDIARIRLIHDLQDQFGINDEAIPVILHLIDQLNRLHLELVTQDDKK